MQASFVVSNLRVGTPHSGPNGVVEWLGIARIDKLIDECRANAVDLQEVHLGVGPGSFVTPLAFNTPLLYECSKVLQMLPRNNHERLLNASSRSPCSTRVIKPKNHNSQIT